MLGQGPSFADPSGIISYVHNFSFGIQRVLPGKVSVDISYVGSRTMNSATTKAFNGISEQSRALGDLDLNRAARMLEQRLQDQPIPRPAFWGGYRLIVDRLEIWRRGENRLHSRTVFTWTEGGWATGAIAP